MTSSNANSLSHCLSSTTGDGASVVIRRTVYVGDLVAEEVGEVVSNVYFESKWLCLQQRIDLRSQRFGVM